MPAKKPTPKESDRAELVLKQTKSSVKHFREAFNTVRKKRKAAGPPTVGEQDLIRASLIFSAAGLDSVIKELIKGSLKSLAAKDADVQFGLEEYAKRQLKADSEGKPDKNYVKFLAKILVSPAPYDQLVDDYTISLTGNSLQSVDELFKAASALGIKVNRVNDENKKIKEIFKIRNKIIHELDVRFDVRQGQKARNPRTKKELDEMSDLLLQIADDFIKEVNSKLITK